MLVSGDFANLSWSLSAFMPEDPYQQPPFTVQLIILSYSIYKIFSDFNILRFDGTQE